MFLRTHRHRNLIIFLAVLQAQALLFHDQLPVVGVGWGGVGWCLISQYMEKLMFQTTNQTWHVMLFGYSTYMDIFFKLNIQPCLTSLIWDLDMTTNNRHSCPANLLEGMEQILLQPVQVEWILGWIYCTNSDKLNAQEPLHLVPRFIHLLQVTCQTFLLRCNIFCK